MRPASFVGCWAPHAGSRNLSMMSSVTVMPEEMHQDTCGQEQVGQEAQDVETVLIDDERRDGDAEGHEDRLAD